MRLRRILTAGALLLGAPSLAAATDAPAPVRTLFSNTLVIYVQDGVLVTLHLQPDGTAHYVDLEFGDTVSGDAATGRWTYRDGELCVITPEQESHCLGALPAAPGSAVKTFVRDVKDGKEAGRVDAHVLVVAGRIGPR